MICRILRTVTINGKTNIRKKFYIFKAKKNMNTKELAEHIKNLSEVELAELEALGVKIILPHTDVNKLPLPTCPQGYTYSNGQCVPDVG